MAGLTPPVPGRATIYRVLGILFISLFIVFSSGCVTESPSPAEDEGGIRLITPDEGFSIFDGQGHYAGLIGEETPDIITNYSMGVVSITPGNATSLHRLLGTSEVVCLVQGEAEIRCDNVTVSAREGEVVVLPDGVLQSIAAVGNTSLHYIDVIQPPFSSGIEVSGEELLVCSTRTDGVPIVIPDPRKGIEWDIGSDMMIYTLANPVLMQELNLPIDYSVAYAELLPGGFADNNRLAGASELIYVIRGEIEVFTPEGTTVCGPAGSAVWIASGQEKGYRNAGVVNASMLSFVDPAWTPERTVTVE